MSLDSDRLFRRIWLANGILLLVLLVGALGLAGYALLNELWGTDEHGARPTANGSHPPADLRPRAIRYDDPELVLNSRWLLVQVRYGADYGEPSGSTLGLASAERGYRTGGPLVNVLFLPADGGAGRLLLDRPAYIRALGFRRSADAIPPSTSTRSRGSPTRSHSRIRTGAADWMTRTRRSSTSAISMVGTFGACCRLGSARVRHRCCRTSSCL